MSRTTACSRASSTQQKQQHVAYLALSSALRCLQACKRDCLHLIFAWSTSMSLCWALPADCTSFLYFDLRSLQGAGPVCTDSITAKIRCA
jgi:hypothetical protein